MALIDIAKILAPAPTPTSEERLNDLLISSPARAHSAHVATLSIWRQAYSQEGLFGQNEAVRADIHANAEAKRPYINQHLRVMEQIRNRRP